MPGPNYKMGDFVLAADAIDPRARVQAPEVPEDPTAPEAPDVPEAPELPDVEVPEVPDAGTRRPAAARRSSRRTS